VVETENKKGGSTLIYFFRFEFAIGDDFWLLEVRLGCNLSFLMEGGNKQKGFQMHTALEQT
jgi:hypothetical protein